MLRKPDPSTPAISDVLLQHYGLDVTALEQLNLGLDPTASAFKVHTGSGRPHFLKVYLEETNMVRLTVPHVLQQHGVPHLIAPLKTASGSLFCPLEDFRAVLYPFIEGENAVRSGLTPPQWVEFGHTLKAVHNLGLAQQAFNQLPRETFDIPSLLKVSEMERALTTHRLEHPAQQRLAVVWDEKRDLISRAGLRARQLGNTLEQAELEFVLCHSDIHAANVMVSGEEFFLVDWDSPKLAPPERDLLFIIGSPIARRVLPEEESLFFAGYGETRVNPEALTYFRYERALEDIGEFAYSILFDTGRSDADVWLDLKLFSNLFEPGDVLDLAATNDPGLSRRSSEL